MKRSWKILIIVSASLVIMAGILIIYFSLTRWGWDWTGLAGFISPQIQDNQSFYRGKTLWDWLELLIVPVVLALAAYWFSRQERQADREAAEKRAQFDRDAAEKRSQFDRDAAEKRSQTDREIATDRLQDAALQSYYDKMTDLLLENDLRQASPGEEVISIARSRTLATLRSLDNNRKGLLLGFLYEAKLIGTGQPVIRLEEADLIGANLWGTNLSGAGLSGADLSGANLCGVNLRTADLSGVNLTGANLSSANLCQSQLVDANLSGADLCGAQMDGANLDGATLSDATLGEASTANAQLAKAASLDGTNLPDGKTYDPAIHTEIARLRASRSGAPGTEETL